MIEKAPVNLAGAFCFYLPKVSGGTARIILPGSIHLSCNASCLLFKR